MNHYIITGCIVLTLCTACSGKTTEKAVDCQNAEYTEVASFNADSAYCHVSAQVDMGPRVPGTAAHDRCTAYIIDKLTAYGVDTIILQKFDATAFTGDVLPLTNIIASSKPDASKRIILAAHYDTRPWGDHDSSTEGRNRPIPGANDGASGVGVLLEIARVLQQTQPEIGIDYIFFDGEDYGRSDSWGNADDTWCLGAQYWANNRPQTGVKPSYGIVFDMVGAKGAKFHREAGSDKNITEKIWDTARRSGNGARFVNTIAGSIIDDHLQIARAGIPSVVIIECNNTNTQSFHPTWHTQNDDMSIIDRGTMKAVGQTALNVIYEER